MKKAVFVIIGLLYCFEIWPQTLEDFQNAQEAKSTEGYPYSTYLNLDKLYRKNPELKIFYEVKARGPSYKNPLEIVEQDPSEFIAEIRDRLGIDKIGMKEVVEIKYANLIVKVVYTETLYDFRSVNLIVSGKAKKTIDYQLVDNETAVLLSHNQFTNIELRYKDRQDDKQYTKVIVSEWDEKKPAILITSTLNIEYNMKPVMVYSDKFILNETARQYLPFILEVYKKNGYYYSNLVTGDKSPFIPKSLSAFFIYVHSDYIAKADCDLLALELYAFNDKKELIIYWSCYVTVPRKYYSLNPLYYWEKAALHYPNETKETVIVYW